MKTLFSTVTPSLMKNGCRMQVDRNQTIGWALNSIRTFARKYCARCAHEDFDIEPGGP
jgi:hypothetical protein